VGTWQVERCETLVQPVTAESGKKIKSRRWKMKNVRWIVAGVCSIAALVGAAASPQKVSIAPASRERERQSFAVNLTRAINNAEQNYKNKNDKYADWTTLTGNGDFTETGTKWAPTGFPTVSHAMYARGAEIVPGWKLRLNLSHEGKAYDLTLEDATDPKCNYAAISDERGIIRQSKVIDCPL
jgi:type II secretory pathway pseudopilin PulG